MIRSASPLVTGLVASALWLLTATLSSSALAQTDPGDAPEATSPPSSPVGLDLPLAPNTLDETAADEDADTNADTPPGEAHKQAVPEASKTDDVAPTKAPASLRPRGEPGTDIEEGSDDDVALRLRTPIQALNEHFLGSTSRAVRFDWRRSPITLAADISELIERNNFGQWRFGATGRTAFDDIILEVGLHYYQSYATESSRTLSLTPFVQAGRPNHFELDVNVGYAVAEGVVTPLANFMPPAEMALVALGGARYLLYTQSFVDRRLQDIGLSLVSPSLSVEETDRIERDALGSMLVDLARLHAMVGLGVDVYFQPGLYFSPRAMVALPVLAPVTGSQLGFFWELSFLAGYAF